MTRYPALLVFALVLNFAGSSLAASWDGTRGPFTVVTFTAPSTLPGVPGTRPETTVLFVKCSDPLVTGVRVTLTYREGEIEQQSVLIADFTVWGYGGVVTTISQSQITNVRFTELRDGSSH